MPFIPILQVNTLRPEELGRSEQRFDFGLLSLDTNVLEDLIYVKESAFALGIWKQMQHKSCHRSQGCFPYVT